MKLCRWTSGLATVAALVVSTALWAALAPTDTWPPALPTANAGGTATLNTPDLLEVPPTVQRKLDTDAKATRFVVAKTPPTIDLTYDNKLPDAALNGTGWSAWGDICLASDGRVYSGIGNHGGPVKGVCYIYCWDPKAKTLTQVVDVNKALGVAPEEMHWAKVHAGIFEGNDKKIYFTCTLTDGGKAADPPNHDIWNARIPGGQVYQYDPATGKTSIYANFPPMRVTATTLFDAAHNTLYCCLEGNPPGADGQSLGAFDMASKKWVFQSEPGTLRLDRKIMLDRDGNVYFNGVEDPAHHAARAQAFAKANAAAAAAEAAPTTQPAANARRQARARRRRADRLPEIGTLWKYDPTSKIIAPTRTTFDDAGVRCATRESKDGHIYGCTQGGELFSYAPATDTLTILSKNFLNGEYVTVCDLSPDEKYVYYLPGAHGQAGLSGTPVMQYDIARNQEKVLAFLCPVMEKRFNYAPGGTYGVKISQNGSMLFVNLNGSLPEAVKPKKQQLYFGLTSFAEIDIPASERGGQ